MSVIDILYMLQDYSDNADLSDAIDMLEALPDHPTKEVVMAWIKENV